MGLIDVTNRLAKAENYITATKLWMDKNDALLTSVSDFDKRLSALEGASATEFTDALKRYAALFEGKKEEHGFIFFTDSHDMSGNFSEYDILMHMHFFRAIFENSPAKYILHGGDWINTGHTLEDAKYFISRMPNLVKTEISPKCYLAVGNHDLNGEGNQLNPERAMTEEQLAYLWYGKDVGYYKIDENDTCCFVFDSGNQQTTMTAYRWDQIDWFANALLTNTKTHLFGLIHIIYINKDTGAEQTEPEFGRNVTLVADAFNQKTSITLNGVLYDFSNATGTFHFIVSGHYHNTQEHVYNNIPVIWSPNGLSADCVYVDFENATLNTVRVSAESAVSADREITIIPTGGYQVSI